MGWNIGVLISEKNESENIEVLEDALGLSLKAAGQTDFETASASFKENFVDVFFSKKGSLFLLPITSMEDEPDFEKLAANKRLAYFLISDVSSIYLFQYFENSILKRTYLEIEGDVIQSEGRKMKFEDSDEYFDDKMAELTFDIIGRKFWNFQDSEQFQRFEISEKT